MRSAAPAKSRAASSNAGGGGLVELERVEPAGVDRGIEQRVVGIYEHADAGHGRGDLSGKAGGSVEGEVAGRGREEDEADVARTACEGGAQRVGIRQAADFGQDGHGVAIPRRAQLCPNPALVGGWHVFTDVPQHTCGIDQHADAQAPWLHLRRSGEPDAEALCQGRGALPPVVEITDKQLEHRIARPILDITRMKPIAS
ncbi:hypothetical protein WR25_15130 [Diploscapter pachys]|uniref:Uncharacterized protein n=1 Tax=Diploscapter pachys TaxID=2018661 RepID=A0A2A2M3E2_9BILA|nr:hypothetical protein WR25_15130 [Diploscapter pachys]